MKHLIYIILIVACIFGSATASETKKIPLSGLDSTVLQVQGLIINNINFVVEDALMGGSKSTVQCTVKNKTEYSLNYTVYIAAFDKSGTLISCFGLEPGMNIHEAGKVETLESSGMVDAESKGKVDYLLVKVNVQKTAD